MIQEPSDVLPEGLYHQDESQALANRILDDALNGAKEFDLLLSA